MRRNPTRSCLAIALVLIGGTACSDVREDGAEATMATAMRGLEAPSAPPERARPATRGLDPLLLDSAYQIARSLPRTHSLVVARHGEIVREEYFRGPGRNGRANVKSVSKSILSAVVGIAIAQGEIDGLDQPIGAFFRNELPEGDPRGEAITVGNLLTMQAGLESTSSRNYGRWVTSTNWVRYALGRPMVEQPGGRMVYSTGSSHLLSAIVTRATGTSTHAFAREHLAKPLGIDLRPWPADPQGIYFGGNEMRLTPRDMVKFGELYRNGGRYEGRQIIPEEWVRDSWRVRTHSRYNGYGYGLGWWNRTTNGMPVHFAWGYGGQFIFIVPGLELTVVVTSESEVQREGAHLRAIHSLLDDVIVPAAIAGAAAS